MVNEMNSEEYNLMGFCGLCCEDCFNRKGEIADLARDLRKKLHPCGSGVKSVGMR